MNKHFFEKFNKEVEDYINNGTSMPQAVSLVSKKYGVNPYKIMKSFYSKNDTDNSGYRDIKTEEGSFVTLKNDLTGSQYEVININNKDAIVLRNTDNNEEIVASETELTPVITENDMKKINEAQYSVSINGLETQDASALSQLFNAASQADQGQGIGMNTIPEPMDTTTGMPMDMSMDMTMDSELPEDDVVFDEELPMDSEIGMEEPSMDTGIESIDTEVDTIAEPDMEMDSVTDMESDSEPDMEEPSTDMSMDDMMDNGMYDDQLNDVFEAAGVVKEAEEMIPGDDFIEDFDEDDEDGEEKGEQEHYAEELTEDFDEMSESTFDKVVDELYDTIVEQLGEDAFEMKGSSDSTIWDAVSDFGPQIDGYEDNRKEEYVEALMDKYEDGEWKYKEYQDDVALKNGTYGDDELEEQLQAVFKSAGVKLDEEAVKTVKKPSKVQKSDKKQRYKKVDTTTFGQEASEGAKRPLNITCESTFNKDKIKSIYETAKRMYAKNDTSMWNSLDRRYIEKLIKEGCSYGTSSKIIMEAKKNK